MEIHLLGEILGLLLIACGVALFAEWIKQPYAIALVVALSPNFSHKNLFLVASFGIVLVTLLIQGLTMKPLVLFLGIQEEEKSH